MIHPIDVASQPSNLQSNSSDYQQSFVVCSIQAQSEIAAANLIETQEIPIAQISSISQQNPEGDSDEAREGGYSQQKSLTLKKLESAYEKLQTTGKKNIGNKVKSSMSMERIVSMFANKKYLSQRNSIMQPIMERLEYQTTLDIEDEDTTSVVIFLLQKPVKNQREIRLLEKYLRQIKVFQENEELMSSSSIWNRIVQNLKCVFIRKHETLFSYGDKGDEYFILLKGKAYCLIPIKNMVPIEDIAVHQQQQQQQQLNHQHSRQQPTLNENNISNVPITANVTEEKSDEEFLALTYPRSQCVKIYSSGQTFGEIALLTSQSQRMASIVCKEDSYFISLDREGYNEILGSYQKHIMNERMHFLKQFSMFNSIANNKILSLLHESTESKFSLGQTIYAQGEKVNKIYFIVSGEVELSIDFTLKPSQPNKKKNKSIAQPAQKQQEQPEILVQQESSNQRYSSLFAKNIRSKHWLKSIVRLPANTYFGDEDLGSNPFHTYSAVSVAESTRTFEIDARILIQFLKVHRLQEHLTKTAKEKAKHYALILESDSKFQELQADSIELMKQQQQQQQESHQKQQQQQQLFSIQQSPQIFVQQQQQQFAPSSVSLTQLPSSLGNIRSLQQIPGSLSKLDQVNSHPESTQQQPETSFASQSVNKSKGNHVRFPGLSPQSGAKFQNVFNAISNSNIRAKNYLTTSNTYNSTVALTLSDVLKTTVMNQDVNEQRRLQFRLAKNISSNFSPAKFNKLLTQKSIPNSTASASVSDLRNNSSNHNNNNSISDLSNIKNHDHSQQDAAAINHSSLSLRAPEISTATTAVIVPSMNQDIRRVLSSLQQSSEPLMFSQQSNYHLDSNFSQNRIDSLGMIGSVDISSIMNNNNNNSNTNRIGASKNASAMLTPKSNDRNLLRFGSVDGEGSVLNSYRYPIMTSHNLPVIQTTSSNTVSPRMSILSAIFNTERKVSYDRPIKQNSLPHYQFGSNASTLCKLPELNSKNNMINQSLTLPSVDENQWNSPHKRIQQSQEKVKTNSNGKQVGQPASPKVIAPRGSINSNEYYEQLLMRKKMKQMHAPLQKFLNAGGIETFA